MKVHKITRDRIFFEMDSGAYGSISREDIRKLRIATILPEGYVDARRSGCMVEDALALAEENKRGSGNPV